MRRIFSVRLIFSIVDIQSNQEADFEEMEEGQESEEDEPIHAYPIRCSFVVTKVRHQSRCGIRRMRINIARVV